MTTHDLLPCDFCGNDDIQDWGESTWSRPVKWMYCTECHAQGPRVMLERNESKEAWLQRTIAAWNTRATPDPLSDPRVKALVEAARAMRNHLDRWQETGAVATAQESKALYDGIDAALRAIEEGGV